MIVAFATCCAAVALANLHPLALVLLLPAGVAARALRQRVERARLSLPLAMSAEVQPHRVLLWGGAGDSAPEEVLPAAIQGVAIEVDDRPQRWPSFAPPTYGVVLKYTRPSSWRSTDSAVLISGLLEAAVAERLAAEVRARLPVPEVQTAPTRAMAVPKVFVSRRPEQWQVRWGEPGHLFLVGDSGLELRRRGEPPVTIEVDDLQELSVVESEGGSGSVLLARRRRGDAVVLVETHDSEGLAAWLRALIEEALAPAAH